MKESKTTYAYVIEHMQDPSFLKVWDIAYDFVHKLPCELCNELHEALNRGVDVLDSEPLLQMYIYAFGKMHNAKLQHAFNKLQDRVVKNKQIEIIDYGCGQGLASICYHDFIKKHYPLQQITKITLIEPSSLALSRAELLCSCFFPDAEIIAINKFFNDLMTEDIRVSSEVLTLHLFSNILDVESYSLQHFIQTVTNLEGQKNEYVIVSPIQNTNRMQRLKTFALSIGGYVYYENYLDKRQLDEEKDWTCAVLLCSDMAKQEMVASDCDKVLEEVNIFTENKNNNWNDAHCTDLFNKLRNCAELGDQRCQKKLGLWYLKGIGTEQNYQHAFEWFQKAVEQSYAPAMFMLYRCYLNGWGTDKDESVAIKFLHDAAGKQHAKSCYTLGYYYQLGKYVRKNKQKSFKLYQDSAKIGYAPSQEKLGEIFKNGLLGKNESPKKSLYWFLKAAEQGRVFAQFYVGYFYANGYGVKKDIRLAFDWYSKAAEQNSAAALNNLAVCYEYGRGTMIDLTKAVYYYEKSAKLGNVIAQKNLATCFLNGIGVGVNPSMVFYWTLEAAKNGDVASLGKIALYYFKGYGTVKNHTEALLWYVRYYYKNNKICNAIDAFSLLQKKANEGDSQALFIIGKCLQYGIVVNKNIRDAYTYFEKGAELGHIESIIKINRAFSLYDYCSTKDDKSSYKDACGVIYSKDKKIVIDSGFQDRKEYQIAKGTRIICDKAFCKGGVEKIIIPSSVIAIGKNPFVKSEWEGCAVNNIECHSSQFLILDYALYTKNKKKLISYFGNAFKVTIPEGVEIIGEKAFYGCNIKELSLPESLIEIEDDAFNSNSNLDSITLPANVRKIGKSSFAFCSIKKIYLNDDLQEIGDFCFFECPIESISIPSKVSKIGMNPFVGTKNIECKDNYKYASENGLLYDKESGNLISHYCETEIALYPPISRVNSFAFYNSNVTGIFIGSNIVEVAQWAFYNAYKLEKVIWRKSKITEIPTGCFGNCAKIFKIEIPSSVENVHKGSFFNCNDLRIIQFDGLNTKANEEMFCRIEPFDIPCGYSFRDQFMGSTIDDYQERVVDFSLFPQIDVIIPQGSAKNYSFSSIYDHSNWNSDYGMDRRFVIREDEKE